MMRHRTFTLLRFLSSVGLVACADSLGVGDASLHRSRFSLDSMTVSPGDTVPPDTSPPPPPPPDTSGHALIRGVVLGIDSAIIPPRVAPVGGAVVTLYAILPLPDSSSGSVGAGRLDSLRATVTDNAGTFWVSGLRQRQYVVRAVAPRGSGFPVGGTRTRAVVVDDSLQAPVAFVYLHKQSR
ncbi:MAG: hypothetical protein U0132_00990 [Gemmatimonadaceae bacterium]